MKKRLLTILTTVLALTILSACGQNNEASTPEASPKPENGAASAQEETPASDPIPEHSDAFEQVEFPKPIGSYTVGRTQMDFKHIASDNSERELTAFIFYPSDGNEGKPTAQYAFSEFHSLRDELLGNIGSPTGEQLFNSNMKTWSYDDLALSEKEAQYPVLFYSHGAGAYPEQGTLYAQDLASAGYIVVSVGHAESGMFKLKDGRVASMSERFMEDLAAYGIEFAGLITPMMPQIAIEKLPEEEAMETSRTLTAAPKAEIFSKYAVLQSEDVRYVADQLYKMNAGDMESLFKGRLQLEIGLGMFGHSFGGTTAAIVNRDDERFVGAVNLDGNLLGALDSDLKKPYLQLGTVLAYNTNAFLLESNSEQTFFAIIDQVTHGDFSDSLFAFTNEASRGTRDAMEQRNIITSYTKAFFDKYMLKKEGEIESLGFNGVEMIKKP